MMDNKPCFLEKVEVLLEDGKTYTFRKLPLTKKVAQLFETIQNEKTAVAAMVDLICISMSYDNTPEDIEDILAQGIIPPDPKKILEKLRGILPS